MRNYSKEPLRSNFLSNSPSIRNITSQKRLTDRANLKEGEVRVGKYKYDISDQLGKGFSSKVYKAVQIDKIHKRLAIKVIDLRKFRGENLQMLETEISIHQSINHQNIVKLYEVIKTTHHYYLVLEYCPHGNLQEYIHQKKNITETSAVEIMSQIINAYKHLMSEGILHRDIKPANVLRFGNKWKISDFGFSVRAKQAFRESMNVGTPLYMAPETHRKNSYSCKSDFFSLGILLYEMVQGRTPWQGSTKKNIHQKMNEQIIIPTNIKNMKIKEFISRNCQIYQSKRMSREQFVNFEINSAESIYLSENDQRESISSVSSEHFKSSSTSCSTQEPRNNQNKSPPKNIATLNKQIFSSQQNFVECLYNAYCNIESFQVEANVKQMLMLTLFKLVLRLSRQLCDKNTNYLKFKSWEEYQTARCFHENTTKANLVSQQYEKEYLEFIKHNDIKVIRAVNRKFPQLCQNSAFPPKFYDNLKVFLAGVIKEQNQVVLQLTNQGFDDLNDRYQALESIYQIYRQVQVRANPESDSVMGLKLKIVPDYMESTLGKNDYLDLRRLLRNI